jgi:ubiquinone/menaquinone biosynthesis C-methylase UbiE
MGGYGYRDAADLVVKRLGLREGLIIVDIGAGDGFWSAKMAEKIGPKGVVHAGEVEQRKVDSMKKKHANIPNLKPYLCPTDGPGLEEDSCDLAFISKTYHHLSNHVDYLRNLKKAIKPSGRVCIIERHPDYATGRGKEHAWMPGLLAKQAEEAGWMLLRHEMIRNSDHFMMILAQPEFQTKRFEQQRQRARKKAEGEQK